MSSEPCDTGLVLKGVGETACKKEDRSSSGVRCRHGFCTVLLHAPRMTKKGSKSAGA